MNGLNAGQTDVSYFVPGMRANGGPQQGAIWNARPMRRAMQAGSMKVLRPVVGFQPNAALRKEEWIAMDEVVNMPRREELVGFSDLQSRGLTFNLQNPLGHTTLEWEDHGEVSPATLSMLVGTMAEDDLVDHGLRGIPLPIVSKGFTLDERLLMAGRNKGQGIDVTNADAAARQVALKVDDLFFNANYAYGGYTLYGYTTHPQRNTSAHGTNGLWTGGSKTGANILADALTILTALYEAKVSGPYVMYIPADYWAPLQADFKTESDKTIMQRLLELNGLEDIRVSFALTDEVVVVSMQRNVVDAVVGFTPMLVQWEEGGGAVNRFRVMAIVVPRVKRDNDATSGVYHMVGT